MRDTCPLDSPLQLLFLLHECSCIPKAWFQLDGHLTEVLNHIKHQHYNEARYLWIRRTIEVLGSSMAKNEIDLSGNNWNLWTDSCIFTSACQLFQMSVKDVYDSCTQGDQCPHKNAYLDTPDNLVSQENKVSHIVVSHRQYNSLQDFFNSEYNYFGRRCHSNGKQKAPVDCGRGIVLEGRLLGCSHGRRQIRHQIVHFPLILEMLLLSTNPPGEKDITNTRSLEHFLTIHGKQYKLVGALLYDGGSHYRSLAITGTQYLVYGGIWKKGIG